jgi:hypothetical protein
VGSRNRRRWKRYGRSKATSRHVPPHNKPVGYVITLTVNADGTVKDVKFKDGKNDPWSSA